MSKHVDLAVLQPNVGFLLKEAAGYSRILDIETESLTLEAGFLLNWLRGQLVFTRTSQGIWVSGALTGKTEGECVRCLDRVSLPLEIPLEELFYYPRSKAPSPTDFSITEDGILDLAEPLREQLVLNVPIRLMCRPDCRGLCPVCGQNFNKGECDCTEETIDPRLGALRQLGDLLSGTDD